MLVGYVSNERYVALPDVMLEFTGESGVTQTRSSASGTVSVDLDPGSYDVVLHKDGFGSKRVTMTVRENEPYHFRLLSDSLVGYVWPKCVQSGEQAEFRVHAIEEYRLELWRYGAEKEFIKRVGTYDEHGPGATMQITPDGDYTQTGIEWNKRGYGNKVINQIIEAPERSGLYYFHATTKSGDFFSFPWVVAPKSPQSKIAVLASDLNWNAYNSYGGRSNYIHATQFPPTPTVNSRLELKRYTDPDHLNYSTDEYKPLSLDRPEPYNHIDKNEKITDPIESRQGCHLAAAEWRLFGWMEQKGFDFDLYSETQFHFEKLNLDDYKLLILSTHPEYWSSKMYFALKSWVFERGGRLMYLGGNGLNCEVEFLDEKTVIYQNTKWNHNWCSLKNHEEKTHPESRFAARQESEANLLGVVFTQEGIMTSAPFEVVDDSHWCFEGTRLKNGDVFGTKSLHMRVPGGASGHETDKMSPHSPKNTTLLAKGLNANNGGAHMVHFSTPQNGGVFSVGSITWPACVQVDEHVSQITANVIRRFME